MAGRATAAAARPLWGAALALPKKPAANNGTKSDTTIRFMTTSVPGCPVVPRRCPTSTWSQTAPSFARARNGWPHHAQTPGGDRRAPWACGRGGRGGASRAGGRRPRHARPTRWPTRRSRHQSKYWSRYWSRYRPRCRSRHWPRDWPRDWRTPSARRPWSSSWAQSSACSVNARSSTPGAAAGWPRSLPARGRRGRQRWSPCGVAL